MSVPGRGAFGARPQRTFEVEIKLPLGFEVNRNKGSNGLLEVDKKRDGLDQQDLRIDPVANGVKVSWRLANPDILPHTASLVVELRGVPTQPVALSSKYKTIRNHFIDTYFHQGRIATYVDPEPDKLICFGDQTIYQGQALMVFSTEMAILRKLGKTTEIEETKKLLTEILNAFDELDQKAEALYGATNKLDGFAVRDDIQGPGDSRLKRHYKEVKSDWQTPEDASPSGDQVFGMMYGLACVVRYSGDDDLSSRAKTISRRLFDYSMRNDFILRMPNGDETKRGPDMRWLSSLLHGLNKEITGEDHFADCKIKIGPVSTNLKGISTFWSSKVTHQLLANLIGRDLSELFPDVLRLALPKGRENLTKLNSFALHILLMAMATSNIITQDAFENIAIRANHHASILWFCQVHEQLPQTFDPSDIVKILSACPETGPNGALSADSGWNKDNRWIRCTNIHDAPKDNDLNNGLDWLLLHNLNELTFHTGDSKR